MKSFKILKNCLKCFSFNKEKKSIKFELQIF